MNKASSDLVDTPGPFSRTISGKRAKFLFHSEILIWVEGPGDVTFFGPVLRNEQGIRIEKAGGRLECEKLAEGIRDAGLPYVVVLDGDYDVLLPELSGESPQVVRLRRYSVENYLAEQSVLLDICKLIAQEDDCEIDREFSQLETMTVALRELVVLDVAHQRCSTGCRVLPNSIEHLLDGGRLEVCDNAIAKQRDSLPAVSKEARAEAESLVNAYVSERPLLWLLRGHLVFGAIRTAIAKAVRRIDTKKPVPTDMLAALASSRVWATPPHEDHRTLEQSLRSALEVARATRPAFSQAAAAST